MKVSEVNNWNAHRISGYNFSIESLNESNFDDDKACLLEYFIEDNHQIFADEFNVEYMGFLIGRVNCTKEKLIDIINEFLNK